MSAPLIETELSGLRLLRRGKVRDVYEVDEDHLLIVATDRISAFDCVLPTPIPRKGEVLTALSRFWFRKLEGIAPHHLITTKIEEMPQEVQRHADSLQNRSMLVRRAEVIPIECVVRGYLAGSGWKDYQRAGEVCGHLLPVGLREAERLPEPIFTPATKADEGHDENISETRMADLIGREMTQRLRELSLKLYSAAESYARTRGIIIADTKFEFGRDADGNLLWIDEALTPDSSRFWPVEEYRPGSSPPSFDKQFVRDYLESLAWDKRPPAPPLPDEIVNATTARYLLAYRLLTGDEL
ncbi:phosphoribosylaminoimidazolesuccinocarboxamide synthase [Pyrinomonas methylaliphatogenes]|uniref:Phosphoribosylaminoimidazole-succinocarboxamide synthase n=1 Tax=Pyrinomonas methylaliphatogenes TaxID=454194 RepID=A0A0B6WWK7_9BACT|nr:phosphoribosylaminoimidazolesuccinocarboxamide synthase [Pyrinomonas methylaliphatogenes]CDM65112.1 phosphoribosylaminoimidazole-succinocarboxamide synthase [Pyrinomonas methylaliphatogenes]